jgi:hypothetical protein
MTPQEKAEELYTRYDSLFKAPFKKHQHLKESALIAVDEILKVASFYNDSQAEVTYWEEVKQELEKN